MGEFTFHPELFETRADVQELLAAHGVEWFSDYTGIDLLHDVHGLEVLGIREREVAERVLALIRARFPDWVHGYLTLREHVSRDPGWKVVVHRDVEEEKGGWQPAG